MKPTTRKEVRDWLGAHTKKLIRISAQDRSVNLVGRPHKVEELDACSTIVHECDLDAGIEGLHITLSIHDDTLAVHITGGEEGSEPHRRPLSLSASLSLPYGQFEMSALDETSVSSRDIPPEPNDSEASEPDFSPYELLHTRID